MPVTSPFGASPTQGGSRRDDHSDLACVNMLPETKTTGGAPGPGPNATRPLGLLRIPLPSELQRVRWKAVRSVTTGAALVIAIAVFILPPTYEATSSFIPVKDQHGAGTEGSAGIAQALGIGINTTSSATSTYPEVLRSRSLIETVITKPVRDPVTGKTTTYLDVMNIPERQPDRHLFRAVREFQKHLRVIADQKSGVFYVTLEGRNPGLLKIVVNDVVAELQHYTVRTRSEIAGQSREFIEREKVETNALLAGAEGELNRFRERNLRIGNSPQLLLEQDRLVRNLRVQEEVYLALVRQYEFAKLDEDRSTPMISVLDPAIQPPFRSAPSRLLLFVLGVGCVFLVSVALSSWLTSPGEPSGKE